MSAQPKIIVHCLVKNEDRFVWYALRSVLPFVDKIMVWDTGSTDNTVKIIRSIQSSKLIFKQLKIDDEYSFTQTRQQMLEQTPKSFTWLMILDGDEVWPENSIKTLTSFARANPDIESIITKTYNLVGDIYHALSPSTGHYHLAGHSGHLNLRLINLKQIPGLHTDLPHGQQGYFDSNNNLIQNRNSKKIKFLDISYHHATHLQRSSFRSGDKKVIKRSQKFKYEWGVKLPVADLPKIFFAQHPKIVPSVIKKASLYFYILASLLAPLKLIKRFFLPSPRSGY